MRVGVPSFALICSSLALSCGSDETDTTPAGGTQGSGGFSGSAGGSGASTSGSGGSTGGSGASTGGSGASTDGSGGSMGGSAGSSGGSAGSGGSLGATDGGSADAGIDAGEVRCTDTPAIFPKFDAACWDNTWCAIGFHQVDCCGNLFALGMLHPELERFAAAEKICNAQYPRCGCPTGPSTTDTGQTATDVSKIAVECRAGVCTTFVPIAPDS